jgi:hypothetical protein
VVAPKCWKVVEINLAQSLLNIHLWMAEIDDKYVFSIDLAAAGLYAKVNGFLFHRSF